MTKCVKICGRRRQVCIGSMDKLITLQIRALTEPVENSVDYSEGFTAIENVWADVKTTSRGEVVFDRANQARQVSHIFGIRYRDDVTTETWIEYEDNKYDILDTEDLEERHDFLLLKSVRKGDKTLPINQV